MADNKEKETDSSEAEEVDEGDSDITKRKTTEVEDDAIHDVTPKKIKLFILPEMKGGQAGVGAA